MKYQQHIIIDGYNYIFRRNPAIIGDHESLWRAREELVSQIIAYRGNKQIQISIVFDGQDLKNIGRLHRPRGIHVLFSSAPQKADPLIIEMVHKAKQTRDITVVTSDSQLAAAVSAMGCLVLSVENFADKLYRRNERHVENKYNVNLSPDELDEWIDLFSNNDDKK